MEKVPRDGGGMIVHIYIIIALEKKLLVIRFFKTLDFKTITQGFRPKNILGNRISKF